MAEWVVLSYGVHLYFARMAAVHASYYTDPVCPARRGIGSRVVRRLASVLLVLFCLGALAGAPTAAAQSSPFAPLPTPAPDPTPTQTQAPTTTTSKGLGTGTTIGLIVLAIVLITAIAYAIARDARRSAAKNEPKRVRPPATPAAPPAPGARGRPTGKGGAKKRRKR
jgi:hypothetical protein